MMRSISKQMAKSSAFRMTLCALVIHSMGVMLHAAAPAKKTASLSKQQKDIVIQAVRSVLGDSDVDFRAPRDDAQFPGAAPVSCGGCDSGLLEEIRQCVCVIKNKLCEIDHEYDWIALFEAINCQSGIDVLAYNDVPESISDGLADLAQALTELLERIGCPITDSTVFECLDLIKCLLGQAIGNQWSIYSKVCALDFSEVASQLDITVSKLCDVSEVLEVASSKVCVIDELLEETQSKVCVTESKVDEIGEDVLEVFSKVCIVEEDGKDTLSKTCIIESILDELAPGACDATPLFGPNVTITESGSYCLAEDVQSVEIQANNVVLDLNKHYVTGSTGDGINIAMNLINIRIFNGYITETSSEGIFVGCENIELIDLVIENTRSDGIEFNPNCRNLLLQNVRIINPANWGILFRDDIKDVRMFDIVIYGSTGGIQIGARAERFVLSRAVISSIPLEAIQQPIFVGEGSRFIKVQDVCISDFAQEAICLDGSSDAIITDVTLERIMISRGQRGIVMTACQNCLVSDVQISSLRYTGPQTAGVFQLIGGGNPLVSAQNIFRNCRVTNILHDNYPNNAFCGFLIYESACTLVENCVVQHMFGLGTQIGFCSDESVETRFIGCSTCDITGVTFGLGFSLSRDDVNALIAQCISSNNQNVCYNVGSMVTGAELYHNVGNDSAIGFRNENGATGSSFWGNSACGNSNANYVFMGLDTFPISSTKSKGIGVTDNLDCDLPGSEDSTFSKLCVVESKVDVLLDGNLDFDDSKICVINSKIGELKDGSVNLAEEFCDPCDLSKLDCFELSVVGWLKTIVRELSGLNHGYCYPPEVVMPPIA